MKRQPYTQADAFADRADDLPLLSGTPVNATLPDVGIVTIKAEQLGLAVDNRRWDLWRIDVTDRTEEVVDNFVSYAAASNYIILHPAGSGERFGITPHEEVNQ